MSTIAQGTLYRFREGGGFPEVPKQPLDETTRKSQLKELEDLFVATRALDQSQQDSNPAVGAVELCRRDQDPSEHECRTVEGDTRSGQVSVCLERWSDTDCDQDRTIHREARFRPEAVDSIQIQDTPDGVDVHVWHLDRACPAHSYQQTF